MSMELYVFLNRSEMLSPASWQQAIKSNSFDLQLDQDFDPFTFTGFLPCTFAHRSSGFEYYFQPKEAVAPAGTYLAPPAAAFDSVITFISSSSFDELASILIAASSLAATCPSLLHIAEDDSSVPGTQALAYARQELNQIAAFRK